MTAKDRVREVRVRLEPWEYEALQREAETRGTTVGNVIRDVAHVCALKYAASPDREMRLREQSRYLDKVFSGQRSIRLFETAERNDTTG